jgi:SHS family lactate transporter-like MFS transporter
MKNNVKAQSSEGHGAALFAGFLGWTLDAFDFFLVVVTLTAIAKEFHRTDKEIALSIALTLGFRPVGAFIFGLLADRYGRRLPLMLDLVFYSIVEVLSGLAPNYATFMVLRARFGTGMGGEWGVGASAAEKVPPGTRRALTLLKSGYATGTAGRGLLLLCVSALGLASIVLIGGLPALLAL